MAQYIDKAALVAEIERLLALYSKELEDNKEDPWGMDIPKRGILQEILSFINTLGVKEEVECKQPEYSYFETIYHCGKKPRWSIGDTLAYYEFYSDREGEHVLGKVTKVDFDKEQCDWFYTFENGDSCDERSLLEEEIYKKN